MENTTPRFTKEDFLNAKDLVKKLNDQYNKKYDLETVKKQWNPSFVKKQK